MTPRPIVAAALLVVGAAWPGVASRLAHAQAVVQVDPMELPRRLAQLEAAKAAERAALHASRTGTQESYMAMDNKYLAEARKLDQSVRAPAQRSIEQAAGVEPGSLQQGSAGTNPQKGRGAFGDTDSASLSGKAFSAVRWAAEKLGFHVTGEGDYFTIQELNSTVHREPTRYASPTGSSSARVETARGFGHETSTNVNSPAPDANVAVLKNLEKGGHTLDTPPARLLESPAQLQELAKMTQRNIQDGGIQNLRLKSQVDLMKAGYSPEAAGAVPPNGTTVEKTAALQEWMQPVRDANLQAARNTQAQANETMARLSDATAAAEGRLAKARTAGNADALAAARAEYQSVKAEKIQFDTRQGVAREALVRNNPDGGRLLAEARGMKVELINGPAGPRFRTPEGVKTQSQLADMLTEPPLGPPQPGSSLVSRGLNNIGMGLMVVGLYMGIKEAQERAGREAGERGDSTLTSAAKLGAYSVWHGLGGAWAVQSGQEGQARSMAQYQEDLAKGRVDSMSFSSFLYARARGATSGVYQFLGLKGIEDAHAEYTAMKKELLELAVHDLQAEAALAADRKRSEERAARAAADQTAVEKAAVEKPAAPRPAPRPAAPPEPKQEDASVMPNLVRTSWKGEITLQGDEGPAIVLPLTLSIDSYNKISGSFPWSAWFDDEPNQRTLEVTGTYDSKTGAFTIQADKTFTKDSTITQVLSVPTGSGMGTEQKRVETTESKRARYRARLTGNIDGPDAARGNTEISSTSEIIVDGASAGGGTDPPFRGTWRLRRTR